MSLQSTASEPAAPSGSTPNQAPAAKDDDQGDQAGWQQNPSNSMLFVVVALVPLALLILAVAAVFIWMMSG